MEDWQRIGLSTPSLDLVEIKRAYVRQLRQTRPDDDAAAYQALREAYDRMLELARRVDQAPEGSEAEPQSVSEAMPAHGQCRDEAPPAEVPTGEAARHNASPDEAGLVVIGLSPDVVHQFVLTLLSQGEHATVSGLAAVAQLLHSLPLESQGEASARFARLVLEAHRQMPPELVQLLSGYFGWAEDFRTERVLGARQALALMNLLSTPARPIADPHLLSRYGDVLALDRMVTGSTRLKCWLTVAALGYPLQRMLEAAGPRLLARLGLGLESQQVLHSLVSEARLLVAAHVVAVVFAAGWIARGSWSFGLAGALLFVAAQWGGALVALYVQLWLSKARQSLGELLAEALPRMGGALESARSPWIGVMLLLASALLMGLTPSNPPGWGGVALGLGAAGLLLALPKSLERGTLSLQLSAYVVIAWHLAGQPAWIPVVVAWTLASALVLDSLQLPHRAVDVLFTISGIRQYGGRLVLLLCAGTPGLLLWVAALAGASLVRASLALTIMVQLMPWPLPGPWAFPIVPVAIMVVLATLQWALHHLGRRLLPSPEASF